MLTKLFKNQKRKRLLNKARTLLRTYANVINHLGFEIPVIEDIAPSIRRLRRRGKACIKLAQAIK